MCTIQTKPEYTGETKKCECCGRNLPLSHFSKKRNWIKILEWCRILAASQGFYGRLLKSFEENPEKLEEVAKNDFKDVVDFVIFIES